MESTGKYWIPVYNILETDCKIVLAHPKYVKAIRGKKTDKKDAKWIVGRDQQDQILYLKKDADTQIWNLEKVENELHKEPPDHILEAVSGLVSAEQPVWTGSPSALADAVHVGMAANALSKYLNVKSGRLLDEYHVRYENKVRHEGRRITLTYDAESK